jgi:hypothetical protein
MFLRWEFWYKALDRQSTVGYCKYIGNLLLQLAITALL